MTPPSVFVKLSAVISAFIVLGSSVAFAASLTVTAKKLTVSQTATTVPATTCTLTPVADAYVDEANKSSNFGTTTTLHVRAEKNKNKMSYVRFNIAACAIPGGASIQSATLGLFITAAPATTRTYNATRVSTAWTETGINANPAPSTTGASVTASIGSGSSGFLQWNVLAHVQAGVTNGWQIADSITPTGSDTTQVESQFASRESATASQRPTLVITYYP